MRFYFLHFTNNNLKLIKIYFVIAIKKFSNKN